MRNISFDLIAVMILVLLLVSVITRKMTSGRSSRMFICSMAAALAASVFDILSAVYDSLSIADSSVFVLYFFHTCYLLFHSLQGPFFLLFIISFTDMWHKVMYANVFRILISIPYSVVAVLLLTNPFTKLFFSVENGYTHEILFPALYISTAIYVVLDWVFLIWGRKSATAIQLVSMFSMTVLCGAAMIVHLFMPDQLLECIAVAISCFILSMTVQRPEDYISVTTDLFKLTAYVRDSKNSFQTGKHWYVVMLNIANYDTLLHLLGYESVMDLMWVVGDKIRTLDKNLGKKGGLYYLDRGRFRIIFSAKRSELAKAYANMLNNDLKLKIRHNGYDVTLAPCVVLARCPEEIECLKSLMSFGQDFHLKFPNTGQVLLANEIYNADEYRIDAIIEKAIENNSFQVYYQPIYSVERKKFISAEALLRLYDEEYGFISPEIIVNAAEKSGAIHKIGEFVFEEVCKFISGSEFEKLGIEYIEVNLSVAQCMHGDLADKILLIMRKYNVSPDKINLEITETAASYAQRVMTENLNKLSHSGVSFSLDDYGTGYSNMKRVISLPLKIVKLDKSLVDEQHNPKMWIFLQNTVKMIKAMGMEVVVEGIETQEMVDIFSDLKCDFIQGYFFSRPLPKNEFVKLVGSS